MKVSSSNLLSQSEHRFISLIKRKIDSVFMFTTDNAILSSSRVSVDNVCILRVCAQESVHVEAAAWWWVAS